MYKTIQYSFAIIVALLTIQIIGCGKEEYSGTIKMNHKACEMSGGDEYYPEDDLCLCKNGVICEKGFVCDTAIDACMQYKHQETDLCDDDIDYKFDLNEDTYNVYLKSSCPSQKTTMPSECSGTTIDNCQATTQPEEQPPEETEATENECEDGNCTDPMPPADSPSEEHPDPAPEQKDKPEPEPDDPGSEDDQGNVEEQEINPTTPVNEKFKCPPAGETICKDESTLSWCSNDEHQTETCPNGCEKNKCKIITEQEINKFPCDTSHISNSICITDNKKSKHYQCDGKKWNLKADCESECDNITQHCACNPDTFNDITNTRICDETLHTIIRIIK